MNYERANVENRSTLSEARRAIQNRDVSKVFDFDHTLFVTTDIHRQALEIVCGVSIPPDFGRTTLRGKDNRTTMEIVLRELKGIDPSPVIENYMSLREECSIGLALHADSEQIILPGVQELASALRETNQRAGIASQSSREFILALLQRANLADIFPERSIVGSKTLQKAEARFGRNFAKPQPDSILHASKSLRTVSNQILYIGDGRVDAASVAGINNILGVVVNSNEQTRTQLQQEFGGYPNITIVRSLTELVSRS